MENGTVSHHQHERVELTRSNDTSLASSVFKIDRIVPLEPSTDYTVDRDETTTNTGSSIRNHLSIVHQPDNLTGDNQSQLVYWHQPLYFIIISGRGKQLVTGRFGDLLVATVTRGEATTIPSLFRLLSFLGIVEVVLRLTRGVSCSTHSDITVVDSNAFVMASEFCSQDSGAASHSKSDSDRNCRLKNDKNGLKNTHAPSSADDFAQLSKHDDNSYSMERKGTYHAGNNFSSFPGSPRSKMARESYSSVSLDDYDYSKSTEYAYTVRITSMSDPPADKKGGEFRLASGESIVPIEAEASDRNIPSSYTSSNGEKTTNTKDNAPICVGKYAKQRLGLDYSYHAQYVPERQLFHDMLIGA